MAVNKLRDAGTSDTEHQRDAQTRPWHTSLYYNKSDVLFKKKSQLTSLAVHPIFFRLMTPTEVAQCQP